MTNPIPVLEALQKFLAFCAARNDSPNTLRAYNSDLLPFVQCIGHETPIAEMTRKRIREYLFALDIGLKNQTLKRKIAAIRSFSHWLYNERYVNIDPSEGIVGPRLSKSLPDIPSEANMATLLSGPMDSACPERDQLMLELLYGCGLRAAELAGINCGDINSEHTLLVHGKGKKDRLVPVGKCAQSALEAWLPIRSALLEKSGMKTDALFFSVGPRESAERLDVRTVHRVVSGIAEAKGLPAYHPHQLRHACATHMHDHGAPLQAVAILLGHKKLSTTQIYTRVSTGRMLDVYRKAHPHAGPSKAGCR
jgi:integrase/recombinase XerC